MYYVYNEPVKEKRKQIIDIYLRSLKELHSKNIGQIYNEIHNQLSDLNS